MNHRLFAKKQKRNIQLPATCYGRRWSKFLHAYYRAGDHPAKLRLLRLMESLSGDRRIIARVAGGFLMAIDKSDFVQSTIFYVGHYEPEVTEILMNAFADQDVFYDIGANVGYYTCAALAKGVRSVQAFEPDPLSCAVIQLNLRLNNFSLDWYRVFEIALSSSVGRQIFYRARFGNSGQGGLRPRESVDMFEVGVDKVDSLVASGDAPPPTVMKIDVEGYEYNVLLGAAEVLARHQPKLIIFESDPGLLKGTAKSDLVEYLQRYGYKIHHIARRSGILEEVENYMAYPNSR